MADLIPAHRFGALLAETRLAHGMDLDAIAVQSGGIFTAAELAMIETGNTVVREDVLPLLSKLYRVPCAEVVPHRAKLCLDVGARYLRVAGHETQLESVQHQAILDRYLSLLYLVRGIEPGSAQIPLRGDDLAILEASLLERSELIEEQLLAAMAANDPELVSLLERLKKKLWVPGAGLFVGAVGLGALVFASSSDDPDTDRRSSLGADGTPTSLVVEQAPGFVLPSNVTIERAGASPAFPDSTVVSSVASTTGFTLPETVLPADQRTEVARATEVRDESSTFVPIVENPADAALVAETMQRIKLDVGATLPEWTIEFKGPREGFRGLAFTERKVIEIFVRPGDTPALLASVVAHELGHAYDLTYLEDADRWLWMEARGLDSWWVGESLSDFAAGQGDFAEAFALVVAGDDMHPGSHGPVTVGQHEVLMRLLEDRIQPG